MGEFDTNDIAVRTDPRVYSRVGRNEPTTTWWPIEEAPNYEINDKGHIRNKWSKNPIKHRHDGIRSDDPYVIMMVDGKRISRSVYVLLREMQVNRRS